MKKLFLLGLLSAAGILATPIADVKLVSIPSNAPWIGDTRVSPYTLSVNGKSEIALCIDFDDDVRVGETWSAYVSTDGGDISHTYHPSSLQQYEEEAYIYSQITKSGISAQTKIDLQEAAWYIMDPDYYGHSHIYKPTDAALNYATLAQANFKTDGYGSFEIISSVSHDHVQEFLIPDPVATPEPASCALLGGGLFLAGAFRFFRRKSNVQ
jgi:hypothetical protein